MLRMKRTDAIHNTRWPNQTTDHITAFAICFLNSEGGKWFGEYFLTTHLRWSVRAMQEDLIFPPLANGDCGHIPSIAENSWGWK